MARDPWDLSREQAAPRRPGTGAAGGQRAASPRVPDRWTAPGEPLPRRPRDGGRAGREGRGGRAADPGPRAGAGARRRDAAGRPPGAEGRGPADAGRRPARGAGATRAQAPRGAGDPRQVWIGADPPGGRAGQVRAPAGPAGGLPPRGPDGPRHARRGDGDGGEAHDGRPGRRTGRQRLLLGAGVTLVVLCLLGASVGGYALMKYYSIERVRDLALAQAPPGEPENFLVVAVDTREGHNARNTDTIMVVRVDPKSDRLALTSFPRDLMVTIADTGRIGMINSAYARDSGGEQVLIDTLRQNFDITINHFVEVNFDSFKQVVDAIGGVSIYMERAGRDRSSGFHNYTLGCVQLDGQEGLEFARSRKLEVMIDGEWERDPLSDEHRVLRQQVFVQRAMSKALSQVRSNPLRLRELVDIGVSNVRLDDNLGLGDLLDLGEQFKDFDPAKLETYPLPVEPYPPDPYRLLLDEAAAEPSLNVFRGLAPGEIRPGLIDVTVLNGTVADEAQQKEGLATDVSGALQRVGFDMRTPSDADEFYAQTTIEHAPGQKAYAQRLARHLTSDTPIPMVENPDLEPGEVTLIAGADFTTVHEIPTPVESMPGAAPAGGGTGAGGDGGGGGGATDTTVAETTTTTADRPTTTTTENPFILGTRSEQKGC